MTTTQTLNTMVTSTSPAITPPPNLLERPLAARQAGQTDCDGSNVLFCGPGLGTCYAGPDGFVGCCTASSCAARTTCIPSSSLGVTSCNLDTGGCVPCTDVNLPECFTLTNPGANIYALYCTSAGSGGVLTTNYPVNVVLTSTASDAAPSNATTTAGSSSAGGNSNDNTSSSISSGAIAGIAVGSAIVGVILALIIAWQIRKRRHERLIARSTLPPSRNWSPTAGLGLLHGKETDKNVYLEDESTGFLRGGNGNNKPSNNQRLSELDASPPQHHYASGAGLLSPGKDAKRSSSNTYPPTSTTGTVPSPAFSNISNMSSGQNSSDYEDNRVSQLSSGNGAGFDGAAYAPYRAPGQSQQTHELQPRSPKEDQRQQHELQMLSSKQGSVQPQSQSQHIAATSANPEVAGSQMGDRAESASQLVTQTSLRVVNPDPQSASTASPSSPTAKTVILPTSTPAISVSSPSKTSGAAAAASGVDAATGEGTSQLRPTSTATGFSSDAYVSAEDALRRGL